MSNPASPPPAADPSAPWPRSHRRALFAFLAAFLLLIVVFRSVLFPFLMAMYLAYLVEPVIDWGTRGRFLGLKWGRGPILILLYGVVITGTVLLVSCGVRTVVQNVQHAAGDLAHELRKTAPAARLRLAKPARESVWVPGGLVVATPDGTRFRTLFADQIDEGMTDVRVLLEPEVASAAAPEPGTPLEVVDPRPLALPAGHELSATVDKSARGLELGTERYLIAPVAQRIEGMTGSHFAPGLLRDFIADQSEKHGADLGEQIVAWSQRMPVKLAGSLYEVVLVLMLTAFIVVDRRNIARFFASLPPPSVQPAYHTFMRYVDRGLGGVIRGQLLICVVNGLLTWVGLWLLSVKYATLLGFVAGVFSLIPVFGTIASSIPIVMVALAGGGVQSALLALAWISLIHLLEANVFNPLIMGSSAEMHPVIIVFSLLAGEHAFGVWGALLAVPTASLVQSAFKYYRQEVLRLPPAESHGHGAWLKKLLARRKGAATPAPGGDA
ncbi:MAG: AI-2E family transporter [Planctomycetes bacterium]|nr:AI-2E family transporter [Planctomycetota bacterium]